MKLTKLQRYTVYCVMLGEAEKPTLGYNNGTPHNGLCFLYNCIFGSNELYYFANSLLPELYNKIPDPEAENNLALQSDWGTRKRLLQQCIEETSPDKQ